MYKKKAITIIANEQSYQNLATFNDIDELNDTVRKHKEMHKLNKNQLRVLNLLHNYSAKYKGVSFLTKNNIASKLDISRRTVIRACNHLESLDIIKQYETKRQSDMQQTSNAIVIQPIDVIEDVVEQNNTHDNNDDTQSDTQDNTKNEENCHSKKTTNFLKQNNKNNRKGDENTHTFDHTFVSYNVPQKLVQAITPFFPSADLIYAIYKRLKMATREYPVSLYEDIEEYIKTFKQVVYRAKTKRVRSFYGYLYGAFKKTCHDLNSRYSHPVNDVYFNWLAN